VVLGTACGTSPAPHTASSEPPSVTVPEATAPPLPADPTPVPSAIVTPVTLGEAGVLVPDSECFEGPRHFLGFRAAAEAEIEASFFLVGEDTACKVSTRARAVLMLAKAESREQAATCGAWRVANCTDVHVSAAVPSPPFGKVSTFGWVPFDFRGMDAQADGLGEPKQRYYDERVAGTNLFVRYTRAGFVIVRTKQKDIDAFWAEAFMNVDGQSYVVTADSLVRLAQPLDFQPLPALHASDRAPERRPHPWEREN
jgi:hypothetical protein